MGSLAAVYIITIVWVKAVFPGFRETSEGLLRYLRTGSLKQSMNWASLNSLASVQYEANEAINQHKWVNETSHRAIIEKGVNWVHNLSPMSKRSSEKYCCTQSEHDHKFTLDGKIE